MDRSRKRLKLAVADFAAMSLYGIWAGTVSLVLEIHYSKVTLLQWAGTRFFYLICKIGLAHHYGAKLTRFLQKIVGGDKEHWFLRSVAASLSMAIYQQSLYIPSALVTGAGMKKTLFAAKFYFIEALFLGWVYGLTLDWCQKKIAGVNNNNKK